MINLEGMILIVYPVQRQPSQEGRISSTACNKRGAKNRDGFGKNGRLRDTGNSEIVQKRGNVFGL